MVCTLRSIIAGTALLLVAGVSSADVFSPNIGLPGATVAVSGQAKPNSFMSAYFYCMRGCGETHVGTVTVNTNGQYDLVFDIPKNAVAGGAYIQIGCDSCGNGWRKVPGLTISQLNSNISFSSQIIAGRTVITVNNHRVFSPQTIAAGSVVTVKGNIGVANTQVVGAFVPHNISGFDPTFKGWVWFGAGSKSDINGNYSVDVYVPPEAGPGPAYFEINAITFSPNPIYRDPQGPFTVLPTHTQINAPIFRGRPRPG